MVRRLNLLGNKRKTVDLSGDDSKPESDRKVDSVVPTKIDTYINSNIEECSQNSNNDLDSILSDSTYNKKAA